MPIKHAFTNAKADGADATVTRPSNWNADHTVDVVAPSGLTGATTATRYVGGTASVAPTTGTFAVGDFVITAAGSIYICTVAGSPGTWVAVSGGLGTLAGGDLGGALPTPIVTGIGGVPIVGSPAATDILQFDGTSWVYVLASSLGGTGFVTNTLGGKEVVSTVATSGAAQTLNLVNGNVFDVTLTAACSLTFSGATAGAGCSFVLLLRQDGTGGWATTWPGSVVWPGGSAPTPDTTASTLSEFVFETIDGGTTWLGHAVGAGGGGTPATTVTDETTWGITPAVGTGTKYARDDHTHGSPAAPTGGGFLMIADVHSTPLVFDDILQADDGSGFLYMDS